MLLSWTGLNSNAGHDTLIWIIYFSLSLNLLIFKMGAIMSTFQGCVKYAAQALVHGWSSIDICPLALLLLMSCS